MDASTHPAGNGPAGALRASVRTACLAALALVAVSCGAPPAAREAPGEGGSEPGSDRLALGRATYLEACAGCHDDGVDGAPVIGEPGDWTGRSHLWQSVLFEHAERGYLAMPAQASERGEAAVDAAAEYMLLQSHPGVPPD